MELLPKSSKTRRNSRTATTMLSSKNIEKDDSDEPEKDTFSTQQLFCFAWQIARGMVIIRAVLNILRLSCSDSNEALIYCTGL